MAIALERHVRRDDSPAFDPRMFYTLNNLNLPRYTLSAGIYTESNGAINLTDYGSLSSENWQLFFQSGRYFIRNYDYGAKWQLGLTEDSRTVPKLYPRSGSISQQWTLNKVNGGWEMVNELWGAGTAFALPHNWPMAAMRSEPDGTVWNITSNPSAGELKPITGDMLSRVEGFQALSSTPSATSTPTSTSSSTTSATYFVDVIGSQPGGGFTSATLPTSRPPNDSTTSSSSSSSLSSGAIAGIVIGGIALFSAIIFAIWFFIKRRQMRKKHGNPYDVHGESVVAEKYAHYHGVELAVPPAELPCRDKNPISYRAELESPTVDAAPGRGAN